MTAFSTDRLQHYLRLAQSASASEARSLCLSATSDALLFEFGELLSLPALRALADTADAKYHDLLRLFAYGTVDDYRAAPDAFPPLTPAHWDKLRVLTLVSLANGNNDLEYAHLKTSLAVETVRQVEDVVLHAVYSGLVRARMDQRESRVEIVSAVGRDVLPPGGIVDMIAVLKGWAQRSTELVDEIDDKIHYIASHTARVKKIKTEAEANRRQGWGDGDPAAMGGVTSEEEMGRVPRVANLGIIY